MFQPSNFQTCQRFSSCRTLDVSNLRKDSSMTAPAHSAPASQRARQNGLLIGKAGLYGNILRLAPMLNTTKPDVDEAIRFLDKSFSEVKK